MTTTWTDILKATGTPWSEVANAQILPNTGSPIGLLMAFTYASGNGWLDISKASGTSWTNIEKAT